MNDDDMPLEHWFPEELSDEAAHAIQLLLQQFTWQFEQTYYSHIRRHIESMRPDPPDGENDQLPWEPDIPF